MPIGIMHAINPSVLELLIFSHFSLISVPRSVGVFSSIV